VVKPFADDIGLVTDGAPDADRSDVLRRDAVEMIAPPLEHRLAAARTTKQEDALLARDVDHHFVPHHSYGASSPQLSAFSERGDFGRLPRIRHVTPLAGGASLRSSTVPEPYVTRGKNETCGVIGLITVYFR
jgi:hypothetical protein